MYLYEFLKIKENERALDLYHGRRRSPIPTRIINMVYRQYTH